MSGLKKIQIDSDNLKGAHIRPKSRGDSKNGPAIGYRQNTPFFDHKAALPGNGRFLLPTDASFSMTTGLILKSWTVFHISMSSSTIIFEKIVDGASMERQTLVNKNDPS